MITEENLYAIALRHCPLIGDVVFRKLVAEVGSAKEVWNLSKTGLREIYGIGNKISKEIGNSAHLKFAEDEIRFCENNQIKINLRHRGEIPALLNECEDAPAILYQKGELDLNRKNISIVGTRNCTTYGKTFVDEFITEINKQNVQTVSGLALGIDTAVHEVSLQNQIPTVAVLAHGFQTLYPSKNRKLSEKILENKGVLFSEFPSSTKPDRENFIQRNRVIAGLSSVTVVVETAFGGGSVSTATFAGIYNREVFALPGKITEKYSQGCNHLIFQNKAGVISTVQDLISLLGFHEDAGAIGELFPSSEIRPALKKEQIEILKFIDKDLPVTLDELAEKMNIPSYKILPEILHLEIFGYIKTLSGRQYLTV